MKIRHLAFSVSTVIIAFVVFFSSCRKINEATELGGGLIPPVDNITTFDTLMSAVVFNDTFGILNDSLRLSKTDEYFLGKISNDPLFGQTDAKIFMELKPFSYPFTFANTNRDSLHIDSVVLVLSYVETYGDTNALQTVNVYEIDNSLPKDNFRPDSFYLVRKNDVAYTNLLGSRSFAPKILDDSVKVYRDTTAKQMRIRLSDAFGQRLLDYDSTSNTVTGAYANDSVFRSKFRGFALESVSGNAIMGFNLADAVNTKLAIYYRYEKNAKTDTTVTYFGFNSDGTSTSGNFSINNYSASANYVVRDYSGTPLMASLNNGTVSDSYVYLQNNPGTFSTIKFPDLPSISNRVLYRAELIVEQEYDISDNTFGTPELLYLDAYDTSIASGTKFRVIPYDLSFDINGNLNLFNFGAVPLSQIDPLGRQVKIWRFNITRYLQHYLTRTVPLYDFRLSAPVTIKENYGIPPATPTLFNVFVNPTIAKGRVRLIGTTGAGDTNPRRLRLRLVYSRL